MNCLHEKAEKLFQLQNELVGNIERDQMNPLRRKEEKE